MNDQQRFLEIKDKIVNQQREKNGIGTLSEKTIHAVLKEYYAPNLDDHEIPIEGYVADIYVNDTIIEIQNGNFNKIRAKLERFLPLYPVTVVYPMPYTKWLIWIDEETGQISKKHKSPKRGNPYEVFVELYKIKSYVKHKNFNLKITMLDLEEFRLLNGWSRDRKKGSVRYDRIPLEIANELEFNCEKDYMQLVPFDMPERFTVKDYAKAAKVSRSVAGTALNMLYYIGVVNRIGKIGNAILYKVED